MVAASQWGPGSLTQSQQRRVADAMIDVLVAAGVDTVFGLPGGTISPLHDALLDRPEIQVITTRHEAGAVFAAAGYARSSNKPGVVLVTSGPGVLNTMTGLASAYCDGIPVVILAGEVPRALHGRTALQEGSAHHLGIVGMVRSITKLAAEVTQPGTATAVLRRAIATAMSGRRGPVLLTLPVDVTSAVSDTACIAGAPRLSFDDDERAAAIHRAADSLWEAKRPVLFAGSGVRGGEGPRRLRALAERLQCPVMTTPKAKGVFPEGHPLSLGVFGHGGHPSSKRYLEEGVDVLLAVGTGFTDPATDGWSPLLIPTGELIRVDVDALQISKNCRVNLGIVGDAADVLERITAELPARLREARRFGIFTQTHPAAVARMDRPISPQRALWELQQAMPPETIYTCDIGEHLLYATHFLRIDEPDAWITLTGLASMGASIGTAIGAKLAQPERNVVAICGDGGFAMMATELATAKQYGIDITVCVLDDGRHGMVENGHRALFQRSPCVDTDDLDVTAFAAAAATEVVQVRHPGDFAAHRGCQGPVTFRVALERLPGFASGQRFAALKSPDVRGRLSAVEASDER